MPPPSTTTVATTTDDPDTTTDMLTPTTRNPGHTVKTTTFFNLNKTFTVGYKQRETVSVHPGEESLPEMTTGSDKSREEKPLTHTTDPTSNSSTGKLTTSRPSNIVKTTLKSASSRRDKTTRMFLNMDSVQSSSGLHKTPAPNEADGNVEKIQCDPLEAYDISWPRATKGEVVSRPCKTGTGTIPLYHSNCHYYS